MKWGVIAKEDPSSQSQFLCDFLKQQGCENSWQWIQSTPENFADKIADAQEEFDALRIASPFGTKTLKLFPKHESWVGQVGAVDSLILFQKQWWPRPALTLAFNELLKLYGDKLDPRSRVLIVGAGAAARMIIAAIVKIGIKHITIANHVENTAQQLLMKLRRLFVGVEFESCSADKIILLPGSYGCLINTTPFVAENEIISELYYFNFLRTGGMVWDLVTAPLETPLIKEARDIGITTVCGDELLALCDKIWLQWALPQQKFDLVLYQKNLKSYLTGSGP